MKHAILITFFCLSCILPGWRHAAGVEGDAHDEQNEQNEQGGIVQISAAELEEFGIVLATAGPGTISTTLSVPGEVRPNADRLAHIVPRYAGIVSEVHVAVGDRVRAGEVLALVESDESLTEFEVTTRLAGTVIEKHLTPGEAVDRGAQAFVIADLSTVWVDLTIYQRDLAQVHVGQEVEVLVGHTARARANISYVTPVLDEQTRSATARVVLDNQDGWWRPGMFVTGIVTTSSTVARVALERTALQTVEDYLCVFVQTGEGFAPRQIETGRMDRSHVEVLDGLSPGEVYAVEGAFTLKAELQKSSFGDGHGH
ncbi:efflux transporter periplasmic adaptor subunit [bacterium]|nr:MAG: efflux transporter periplasmic adaptor subunit [bacterium]RKZ15741.1 MAG: efflux transporter periplasmic adaptor subunit [bacterium]